MFVHGDNLRQKENHTTKYLDDDSRRYLVEIREKYDEWRAVNEALIRRRLFVIASKRKLKTPFPSPTHNFFKWVKFGPI